MRLTPIAALVAASTLAGCGGQGSPQADYFGTEHPFASEAIYFVMTDRFVDGDPSNNFPEDSGWDRPLVWDNGDVANVGFQGGDFKGILDHADYITEMGFTSVWLTPIVENPAEAFTGGTPITREGFAMDRGKAAYHGYWGVNFYRLDKHWPSEGLDFAAFTQRMSDKGLKTVLDVVINHGSPAYSMPEPQPLFGQLYDGEGQLVADHQNLPPEALRPEQEPLHRFFNTTPDLAQLADMNVERPEVMDYFVDAYLQWLGQGAAAFRIDTVKHVPKAAWGEFSRRIRAEYPGLFMFGEVYSFDAEEIGQYTQPENGGMSVLDFPMKAALANLFEQGGSYKSLEPVLYLEDGPYANPYELTTFYDNHDMPRMNASDEGFIDAHNWLFTARGIPVIYYGSEMGFERGKAEHAGNRNYFGVDNIDAARSHRIRAELSQIAQVRQASVALQRGLQLNLEFTEHTASFYRLYQRGDAAQSALVLLNKGDTPATMTASEHLQAGQWREALTGEIRELSEGDQLTSLVPAHGVRVYLRDGALEGEALLAELDRLMAARQGR
ncbi:alpha-amylase family glycosyl hydrolase [Ferrimonas balearica]|uniref:alpha-amylase family glycosyl hydrolase n=1 Tax=Ferrimonas balearica TaxID=44012 RepID=UPI001C99892E|nr:alpha-amylase family glycosyl hydrolase [Ferrimonas balearica]MBY5990795.1 cyclomaltodextrin glucanotransferase [Ferrimonas balearica]